MDTIKNIITIAILDEYEEFSAISIMKIAMIVVFTFAFGLIVYCGIQYEENRHNVDITVSTTVSSESSTSEHDVQIRTLNYMSRSGDMLYVESDSLSFNELKEIAKKNLRGHTTVWIEGDGRNLEMLPEAL